MVMILGLETENKEIESNLREIARGLLKEKKVDVIIGYERGSLPLLTQPIIIDKDEDVDNLLWNNIGRRFSFLYLSPVIFFSRPEAS